MQGSYRALAIGARHQSGHRTGSGDESCLQELVPRLLHPQLQLHRPARLHLCDRTKDNTWHMREATFELAFNFVSSQDNSRFTAGTKARPPLLLLVPEGS